MRFLIIFVCLIAVGVTIATIVVGSRSFEGVVVEKPYECGLAWDREQQETARLGWRVTLLAVSFKTGKNEMDFSVQDRNGRPLTDTIVSVALSRLETSALDRTYPALRAQDGRYRAAVDLPQFGHWEVRVDVQRNRDRGSFKHKIYAGQRG